MGTVLALEISAELTTAVSVVEFTYVVVKGVALHRIDAPGMNREPVTVSVKDGPPANVVAGLIEVRMGVPALNVNV